METVLVVDNGYHTFKHARLSRSQQSGGDVPVHTQRSGQDVRRLCCRTPVQSLLQNVHAIISADVDEPAEISLLLLMHALTARREREVLFVNCFERLGCQRVSLDCLASNALYAGGVISGVTVDVGFTSVRVSTILHGRPVLPLCVELSSVGAYHVHAALGNAAAAPRDWREESLLHDSSTAAVHREPSGVCYDGAEASAHNVGHAQSPCGGASTIALLPDGEKVGIDACGLHRCSSDNRTVPSAAEATRGAWQRLLYSPYVSVPDTFSHRVRKAVLVSPELSNWSVFGGCAGVNGVRSILYDAVSRATLVPTAKEVALKHVAHAAVQGGIILAQLSSFKSMCITAEMYAEDGPERCAQR